MPKTRYAVSVDVPLDHEAAIAAVTELLAAQGFGILSTIDIQGALRKKLGVETEAHTILGACNPPFAHQAAQAEEAVGVLLPCNVAVREREGGGNRVFITRVDALFGLVDNPAMGDVADEVGRRLEAVAAGLREVVAAPQGT